MTHKYINQMKLVLKLILVDCNLMLILQRKYLLLTKLYSSKDIFKIHHHHHIYQSIFFQLTYFLISPVLRYFGFLHQSCKMKVSSNIHSFVIKSHFFLLMAHQFFLIPINILQYDSLEFFIKLFPQEFCS